MTYVLMFNLHIYYNIKLKNRIKIELYYSKTNKFIKVNELPEQILIHFKNMSWNNTRIIINNNL